MSFGRIIKWNNIKKYLKVLMKLVINCADYIFFILRQQMNNTKKNQNGFEILPEF